MKETANMSTKKREVRVAPAATAKPKTPVVPAAPVKRERRVAPGVKPDATAPAPSKKVKPAEKRVAPVAAPAPKKSRKAPQGAKVSQTKKPASQYIQRLYSALLLLDKHGPIVTELVADVTRPLFPSLDDPNVTVELAILEKGIARKVTGTGEADIDGQPFVFAAGEMVLIHRDPNGDTVVYNTKEAEPVEMRMDARAASKQLKMHIVPTDIGFDDFIKLHAARCEAAGIIIDWEE